MTWQADIPFNQLPPLPPAAEVVDSVPVLKACIPARAALAELKQAGALLPNQGFNRGYFSCSPISHFGNAR